MNKLELRKSYMKKRLHLSAVELAILSEKITSKVHETLAINEFGVFHIFLPIKAKNEINTWPIIHFLWQHKKKVVVPATRANTPEMKSFLLTPETKLLENQWGIPEPIESIQVMPEEIQVVFLPLLVFDRQGHRVGYGKGFYDRFLKQMSPNIIKVGLSLFPPAEEIDDVGAWDEKMNWCVTPREVIRF